MDTSAQHAAEQSAGEAAPPSATLLVPLSADHPLTPRDWCYRVLTAVRSRTASGREAGTLETLLSYFIERNPTVAEFEDLLERYAGDGRSDIAAAGTVLRRAWQRAHQGAAVSLVVPLQEVLRTIGGLLDEWGAHAACVSVDLEPQRLYLFGERQPGELAHVNLGPVELGREIAARTALRGQVPLEDLPWWERYEPRLRVVGADLDVEPRQSYRILVTRQTVVIEGSAGYYRVCTSEGLESQIQTFLAQRQGPSGLLR
jgi:hypothetical protein